MRSCANDSGRGPSRETRSSGGGAAGAPPSRKWLRISAFRAFSVSRSAGVSTPAGAL